ncbi:hypothetical protein [Parabacteroides timonensis]|uniref:hypothetical protein n=1 Tax=Parabacteroides timonensis TaxID=1871013 RepID=UPI0011153D2B|nr:hypothetical protein [Parabacteroides timonensis]
MKLLLFIILSFFNAVDSYSQEHLKFMNIPITGNIAFFVYKLKGFECVVFSSNSPICILKGKFAGRDATVNISSSNVSLTVYEVSVGFREDKSLEAMKEDYLYFKKMLIKKYGNPYKSMEKFTFQKINIFKEKIPCTTFSFFKTSSGRIELKLQSGLKSSPDLSITYIDNINEKKAKEEKDTNPVENNVLNDL